MIRLLLLIALLQSSSTRPEQPRVISRQPGAVEDSRCIRDRGAEGGVPSVKLAQLVRVQPPISIPELAQAITLIEGGQQ